jgi:hypothetical protein
MTRTLDHVVGGLGDAEHKGEAEDLDHIGVNIDETAIRFASRGESDCFPSLSKGD